MPDQLKNSIDTRVTIADDEFICEKGVTPPAVDQGEAIDISCMRSGFAKLKWPKARADWLDWTFVAAWDPAIYQAQLVQGQVIADYTTGVIEEITITFPTGTTLTFWGYVKSVVPGEISQDESTQPTVTITVTITHVDADGNTVLPLVVIA